MRAAYGLVFLLAGVASGQDEQRGPSPGTPTAAILAPADGSVVPAVVDVVVQYAAGDGSGNPNVRLVELRVSGVLKTSFEPRGQEARGGTHTFPNVDLAGVPQPIVLVARAYQGSPRRQNTRDSDPIQVTLQEPTPDAVAPLIEALQPADGSITRNSTPTLSGRVIDTGGSGVDPASLAVLLDGAPVTVTATPINADRLEFSLTPPTPLVDGLHRLAVDARDHAGNAAVRAESAFLVDTVAPTIMSADPADGAVVPEGTTAISASWSDAGSGLDVATAVVLVQGAPVAASVSGAGFSYSVVLSHGTYVVEARIADRAGNPAVLSWTFTVEAAPPVDTVAPVIQNLIPAEGSVTTTLQPTLSAQITDTGGSGIDPASVLLVLNGIAVPAAIDASSPDSLTVTYSPATPLTEGLNGFAVHAADLVGNVATPATSSFRIDGTPPTVTINAPTPSQTFTEVQISVGAVVADGPDGSGVPSENVTILLNGADVTAGLSVTPVGDGLSITGIVNAVVGSNTLHVQAVDRAGNAASRSVLFTAGGEPSGDLTIQPSKTGPFARVRILGQGLTGAQVSFSPGITVEEFESESDTALVLRVPPGAQTGPVMVTSGAQTRTVSFEVVQTFALPVPEASILADAEGNPILSTSDLMIALDDFLGVDHADALAAASGATRAGFIGSGNLHVLRYEGAGLDEILSKVRWAKTQPGVQHAAPVLGIKPAQDSTRRRYAKDLTEGRTGVWAWDRIQAPAAWKMLKGVTFHPVKVGVWDTGIDAKHVDFASGGPAIKTLDPSGALVDYTDGDSMGHGTVVAGVIGAASNDLGIDGVMSPPLKQAGVPLTLVHFDGAYFEGKRGTVVFSSHLVKCIDAASAAGVRVMNVSSEMTVDDVRGEMNQGLSDRTPEAIDAVKENMFMFRKAMDFPLGRRILVVLAAGNGGEDISVEDDLRLSLLGSLNRYGPIGSVMIVGAIRPDGHRWGGSNYGQSETSIDIAAPGMHVLAPIPRGSDFANASARVMQDDVANPDSLYGIYNGTSLSAPMVSGAAALIFSINPSFSAPQVKKLLQDNALRIRVDAGAGTKVTWKLLRMADTFAALLPGQVGSKSWGRIYATVHDRTTFRGSIQKLQTLKRSGNTYTAQGEQTFLEDRSQAFSVSAAGQSLWVPFVEGGGDTEVSHIYRYSLSDGSSNTEVNMPYTFVEETIGAVTEKISTSLAINPVAFPSERVLYLSNQDFQPRMAPNLDEFDRARFEPYVTGRGRLTDINRDEIQATTAGPAETPGGSVHPVAPAFTFGHPTVTPDNRWILFWNAESFLAESGSHLYLLPNPAVDKPDYQDPDVRALTDTARFLILSHFETDRPLENVTMPAVSPDGTRLAYVDPRFEVERPLKIVRLRDHAGLSTDGGLALVKPWHYEEDVYEVPGKGTAPAWSPCGAFLIYTDVDSPGVIRIVHASLGEYTHGAAPVSAVLGEFSQSSSLGNLQWSWTED